MLLLLLLPKAACGDESMAIDSAACAASREAAAAHVCDCCCACMCALASGLGPRAQQSLSGALRCCSGCTPHVRAGGLCARWALRALMFRSAQCGARACSWCPCCAHSAAAP